MVGTIFLYIFIAGNSVSSAEILLKSFSLSPDIQNYIVRLHNDFRSKVANGSISKLPSASNMQRMKWCPNLAKAAQNWVNHCTSNHSNSSTRKTIPGYSYAGENWAGGTCPKLATDQDIKDKFKSSVDMWANEHQKFTYPNTCSCACGHFTQITWASTNKVGCGIAQCINENNKLKWRVFCNYGPGGNMKVFDDNKKLYMPPPYTSGKTCSACPSSAPKCHDDGLCS